MINRRRFLKLLGIGSAGATATALQIRPAPAKDIHYIEPTDQSIGALVAEQAYPPSHIYDVGKKLIMDKMLQLEGLPNMTAALLQQPSKYIRTHTTVGQVLRFNKIVGNPASITHHAGNSYAEFPAVHGGRIDGILVYGSDTPIVYCEVVPTDPNGGDFTIYWGNGVIELK